MIAALTTAIAVGVGFFSLSRFGLSFRQIVSLVWPVAVGVALLCVVILAVAYGSLRLLPRPTQKPAALPRDGGGSPPEGDGPPSP